MSNDFVVVEILRYCYHLNISRFLFFHHILIYFVQREKSPDVPDAQPSVISTHGNASVFTVYATVRQAVLAQTIRESTKLYHLANTATDSDSDSDDEGEDKGKELQIKIPKVCLF